MMSVQRIAKQNEPGTDFQPQSLNMFGSGPNAYPLSSLKRIELNQPNNSILLENRTWTHR